MRMRNTGIVLLTVIQVAASVSLAEDAQVFLFDPVALSSDQQVPGEEKWSETRGGYTYRFASEQNRDEFRLKPESYEIQLGGACARMGSLSGQGSVDLFARYNGRLYLFASESCRDSFLKAPEKLLLTDDPPLSPSPERAAKGQEMRQQFLDSVGTEEARRALLSIQSETMRQLKSGGQNYVNRIRLTIAFPQQMRRDEWWNESNYAQISTGESAWFSDKGEIRPMADIQRRDSRNGFATSYAGLFTQLQNSDVVCKALDSVVIDGKEHNQFAFYSDGIRKTVVLEPSTGRALRITLRDHGPALIVVPLTVEFSEFAEFEGLTVPTLTRRVIDGNVVKDSEAKWLYVVNGTIAESEFTPAQKEN